MTGAETHSEGLPPILFLHGVFGRPPLLKAWLRFLSNAGYECSAPALPGREPTDPAMLRRTGVDECMTVALDAYDSLGRDAIVIGHSLGGLLAQKVAELRNPRSTVLLASIPPGVLWPQLRPFPHLFPILPAVLAGRPFLPGPRTMRRVPLSTLPAAERERLVPELVPDSGRVFRAMTFGTPAVRVDSSAVTCPVLCVSAGADRNVAPWISRRIAARYHAEHQIHPGLPHWIIAESALEQVAPPVLEWIRNNN